MELIPDWAPSIHPMVVHFPIAILSIAVLLDFISFFLPKRQKWWTEEATVSLYGIGAAAAVAVYFTGQSAADNVFLPAQAQTVLNTHADWALWTVWFYVIYATVRILVTWKAREEHRPKWHMGFFALSLVGFFLLFQTGDNGARMVFEHGVGVQVAEVEDPVGDGTVPDDSTAGEPAPTAFNISDNGDWSWKIRSGGLKVLREQFHFLNGNVDHLNASTVEIGDGSYALQFTGDDLDAFFVTHHSYRNVQVDYYLDMSAFQGTVTLVSHLQDSTSYDYVSISSDGTVEQGRMKNGQPEVFQRGTVDISSMLFVRAVVNGTHFRGYVDKQMIVHGHGEAPEAGPAGLKMEGSGTLLLERMELVQLAEE